MSTLTKFEHWTAAVGGLAAGALALVLAIGVGTLYAPDGRLPAEVAANKHAALAAPQKAMRLATAPAAWLAREVLASPAKGTPARGEFRTAAATTKAAMYALPALDPKRRARPQERFLDVDALARRRERDWEDDVTREGYAVIGWVTVRLVQAMPFVGLALWLVPWPWSAVASVAVLALFVVWCFFGGER